MHDDEYIYVIVHDFLPFHVAMSTKENVVFTAAVGEELLTRMEQQVFKGRRGVRCGFKDEAYVAVANTMTETSHGAYVLTAESIRSRSEYLKKEFDAVTGLLKASGFRFNRATKRVVASEEVWRNWLEVSLIHHKFFFFACYVVVIIDNAKLFPYRDIQMQDHGEARLSTTNN